MDLSQMNRLIQSKKSEGTKQVDLRDIENQLQDLTSHIALLGRKIDFSQKHQSSSKKRGTEQIRKSFNKSQ